VGIVQILALGTFMSLVWIVFNFTETVKVLLVSRVYALHHRNKKILIFFLVLSGVLIGIGGVSTTPT